MKSLFRKYSIIGIISLIFLCNCTSQDYSQDSNVNRKISQDECERVFVVNHVDYYTVFIYENREIKQVRWGYPQGHRGTILYKAIHHCATDKIVMTIDDYIKIFSGLILNDYQGRSEEISIRDGPIKMTTYKENYLILDTNLIKRADKEVKDISGYIQYPSGTYTEIFVYDLKKREIIDKYPMMVTADYMKIYGDILYAKTGGGYIFKVNLKEKTSLPLYKASDYQRLERWAITKDGEVFFLTNYRTKIYNPKQIKRNTVYKIKDGQPVKVFEIKEPDPVEMIAVGDDLYVFTFASEKVIKYNVKTKKFVKYNFPYKMVKNVNYIKGHFVISLKNPQINDYQTILIVVDFKFKEFSKPYKSNFTKEISTFYDPNGGEEVYGEIEFTEEDKSRWDSHMGGNKK